MLKIRSETNLKAVFAGILAIILWGAIPALVKVGAGTLPISFLLLLRFTISFLLVLPIILKTSDRFKLIDKTTWAGLLIVLGANYFFQALAMVELPISWYVVIFSLNPVLALLSLRLKINLKSWMACGVAAISTFVFVRADEFAGHITALGVISLVVGMLTWVGYTYIAKRLQGLFNDGEVTAITQMISMLSVLIMWLGQGTPVVPLSSEAFISVLVLGITSPLAYWSFSYSLRYIPVFCIMSQYLEPVVGLLLGFFYFNEVLGTQQLVGSTLLILSMGWFATISQEPKSK